MKDKISYEMLDIPDQDIEPIFTITVRFQRKTSVAEIIEQEGGAISNGIFYKHGLRV